MVVVCSGRSICHPTILGSHIMTSHYLWNVFTWAMQGCSFRRIRGSRKEEEEEIPICCIEKDIR